ncbi:MAG: hypothetical protein J6W82_02045 [Bacteroidales bacterium]|nr:hypothetical protein [Bacteroidales bacterium]
MIQALYSKFIIDGVPRELTPYELLAPVFEKVPEPSSDGGTIIDETIDPAPGAILLDAAKTGMYLKLVNGSVRTIPVPFTGPCTRGRIAEALIDTTWRVGNFRLEDLPLTAKWIFNPSRVGDMSAYYSSVEAAAEYIDALGVVLRRCVCEQGLFDVRFATPFSGAPLLVDDMLHPDPQSWIMYVPFDTSEYRLGGSLLSQALGLRGGFAPQVTDADYLIDCFELVRELAVDGVLLSATTVGPGSLYAALDRMRGDGTGVTADISGIISASGESDVVRLLFSEVPGAIIQVRDADFDYIDAEFILQDVAYFPLGHPSADGELHLASSAKTGIQTILESLMQNAEGED